MKSRLKPAFRGNALFLLLLGNNRSTSANLSHRWRSGTHSVPAPVGTVGGGCHFTEQGAMLLATDTDTDTSPSTGGNIHRLRQCFGRQA
jgi:hypothetical protein